MEARYIKTGTETYLTGNFNTCGLGEVLTGDDSALISELEIFVPALQIWKPLRQAFKDGDLITDNYNIRFFEPRTEEDRKRGYTL